MHIVVDGYNFIKGTAEVRDIERIDLQKAREALVDRLAAYKRLKGHAITVVFDGAGAGGSEAAGRPRGIAVIFSKGGQKADDVLKRLAGEKRGGIMVVTSDREVAHFAEKKGATIIGVAEFAERMEMAKYYELKGGEGRETADHEIAPDKKGPSRRLPKSRRKSGQAIRKL